MHYSEYLNWNSPNVIQHSPAAHGAAHCPWGGYTDQIVCNMKPLGPTVLALQVNKLTDFYTLNSKKKGLAMHSPDGSTIKLGIPIGIRIQLGIPT